MKRSLSLPLVFTLLASTALAEGTRELDAHEHGLGELNIAIDGDTIAMEFHAPGADIVGFEHPAESDEDRAAIAAAVAALSKPLDLFMVPAAAECMVKAASAELESEEDRDDHEDHDDHDDHGHDDHAEKDDHDDHAHDDHPEEEGGHTEFHAEYQLTCANPGAISEMAFAYFDAFPNARELTVQVVTSAGAQAFDVERDAPKLDLNGMF